MTRLIPILLTLALIVGGILLIPNSISKLKDTRLEQTRTALPGSRTVELEHRKYIVWIESRGNGLTDSAPSPDDVNIQIRPASGGARLQLNDYAGSYTTSSGGRNAAAFATVTPPRRGRYAIAGDAGRIAPATADPTVVLGLPTTKAVLALIAALVMVAIGFVGTIVAIILAVVLPKKEKREAPTDAFGN